MSPDGGLVFFSSDSYKSVLALDASTGAVAWRYDALNSFFVGSPAVADDGNIYVGAQNGYVYALTSAGALRWSTPFYGPFGIVSTPALSAQGTVVYVASSAGTLSAVKATDGTVLWSSSAWTAGGPLIFGFQSSPALSDDGTRVLVGTWEGELLCFTAATGALRWSFNASAALGIPSPSIIATPALSVPSAGRELVYSATAYLDDASIDAYSTLFAVDAASGMLVWRAPLSTSLVTAPVVGASGVLYVSSFLGDGIPGGGLAAYDGASGALLWTKPLGESLYASPSMGADGTLYIGGTAGEFLALAPMPSAPPAPSALPSTGPSPPIAPAASGGLSAAAAVGLAVFGGALAAAAALGLWFGAGAWLRMRRKKDSEFSAAGLDSAYEALETF